jgi:hypothetical protein
MVVSLGVEVVNDLILKTGRQHLHHDFVIRSAVLVPVLETFDLIVLDSHDKGVLTPAAPVLVRVPDAREMAALHGGIDALGRHGTSIAVSVSQGREMSLLGSQLSGDRIPRVAVLARIVKTTNMTSLSSRVRTLTPPIKTRCRFFVRRHEAAWTFETVLHGPGYVGNWQLGRLDDCARDAEQGSRVVDLVRHGYVVTF